MNVAQTNRVQIGMTRVDMTKECRNAFPVAVDGGRGSPLNLFKSLRVLFHLLREGRQRGLCKASREGKPLFRYASKIFWLSLHLTSSFRADISGPDLSSLF